MINPLEYSGELASERPRKRFKETMSNMDLMPSALPSSNNEMMIEPSLFGGYYNQFRNPSKSHTHRVVTELKVFDTENPTGGYPLISRVGGAAGDGLTLIFAPAANPSGTRAYDITNRVARKTNVTSIFLRGEVLSGLYQLPYITTSQNLACTYARIAIVFDRQPPQSSSLPKVSDIISSSSNLSYDVKNNDQVRRFYFIMDKVYNIGGVRTDLTTRKFILSEGRQSFLLEKYIKCNLETIFNSSTTADISSINSGAIYLMTIGNNASITNGNPVANLDIRIRFVDCY